MSNPAFDLDDVNSFTRRAITDRVVLAKKKVAIAQAEEAAALAVAEDFARARFFGCGPVRT